MPVDPGTERRAIEAAPQLPRDEQGPVFNEPWEAQAFAIVLSLQEQGVFEWPEWSALLGEEIKRAQAEGDPDNGDTYFIHWMHALERLVSEKGLTDFKTLVTYHDAWANAAERTPHGKPIELQPHDFSE